MLLVPCAARWCCALCVQLHRAAFTTHPALHSACPAYSVICDAAYMLLPPGEGYAGPGGAQSTLSTVAGTAVAARGVENSQDHRSVSVA